MQCFERPLAIKVFARDVIHLWWYPRKRWKSQWKSMSSKKVFQSQWTSISSRLVWWCFASIFQVSHYSVPLFHDLHSNNSLHGSKAHTKALEISNLRPWPSPFFRSGETRMLQFMARCVSFFFGGVIWKTYIHTCVHCILHISVVFYGIPYSHIAYIILTVPSMRTNLRRHDIMYLLYYLLIYLLIYGSNDDQPWAAGNHHTAGSSWQEDTTWPGSYYASPHWLSKFLRMHLV